MFTKVSQAFNSARQWDCKLFFNHNLITIPKIFPIFHRALFPHSLHPIAVSLSRNKKCHLIIASFNPPPPSFETITHQNVLIYKEGKKEWGLTPFSSTYFWLFILGRKWARNNPPPREGGNVPMGGARAKMCRGECWHLPVPVQPRRKWPLISRAKHPPIAPPQMLPSHPKSTVRLSFPIHSFPRIFLKFVLLLNLFIFTNFSKPPL